MQLSDQHVLCSKLVQYTHSTITQLRYRKPHIKRKCLRSPTKYFGCSTKANNMCTHFTLYHGWQSSPSQFRCASPARGKIRCSCVNLNNLGGFQSHHHQLLLVLLLLSFLIIIKIIINICSLWISTIQFKVFAWLFWWQSLSKAVVFQSQKGPLTHVGK